MMPDVDDQSPQPVADDAITGLPILRTWPRVYVFVLGCFILWVALMFALEKSFS